jgi:hypothetical protein
MSDARVVYRYRDPEAKLADRLARIDRHRQHVQDELRSLEKFLNDYPDLRQQLPSREIRTRLRLVVDNVPRCRLVPIPFRITDG